MPSKSRNVNGYVKRVLKFNRLNDRLTAKLAALQPLKEQVAILRVEKDAAYLKLTGAQAAEAARILTATKETK